MIRHNLTLALFIGALLSAPVMAGTIEIQLSGVNLNYSDPDADGLGTGTLVTAGGPVDSLIGMDFLEDNSLISSLPTGAESLGLEFSVSGIPSIAVPALGQSTTVTSPVDTSLELTVDGLPILELAFDSVDVIYTNFNVSSINIRFLFAGSAGTILGQDLPFSAAVTDPVLVSFNLQGPLVETNGYLQSFTGSGGGVLTGTIIPEPNSMALLGLASLMSLVCYTRYKLG